MKTRIFIILFAISILPVAALAQDLTAVSHSGTKTKPSSLVNYFVYEVHNSEALINGRKAINTEIAEKDRPLAHGTFLAFNPHVLEQVAGGKLENGKLNFTYYKKPVVLFVVLTQRFKNGQLDAALINVEKKTGAITVRWTGKEMKVELELCGQPM